MAEDPDVRIELPETLGEARNIAVDCFRVLGHDLFAAMDPTMSSALGPDWYPQITGRPDSAGNTPDLYVLLQEARRNGSVARDAFPRTQRWFTRVDAVLGLRNETAHKWNVSDPLTAVKIVRELAATANLPCTSNLEAVAERIVALHSGTYLNADARKAAEANERADRADARAREMATSMEQAESEDRKKSDLWQEATRQRDDTIVDLNGTIADMLSRGEATAAAALLDSQAVELETTQRRTADEKVAAQKKAKADKRKAAAAARRQVQDLEDSLAQTRREQTQQDILQLLAELKARQRQAELVAAEHARDALADAAVDAGAVRHHGPPLTEGVVPPVGQAWPFAVGAERWRLSKRGSMTRGDDDLDLDEAIGVERAKRFVADALALRPDGGRVLVDEDGDAVTWHRGGFIYLGRLTPEPAAIEAVPGVVLEGAPEGRKYRMTLDGTITPARGAPTLASVVGKARAAAVAKRVRAVKRMGGSLWIDNTGLMTAWVNEGRLVVTTVKQDEWFPL